MSRTKIYKKEQIEENPAKLWDFPYFGDEAHIPREQVIEAMPTADEMAAMQQQVYDEAYQAAHAEGFAKGMEEGRQAGHAEGVQQGIQDGIQQGMQQGMQGMQERVDEFAGLLDTLSQPLLELDHEVEQQLVALAMQVAKHVVRREIKTDPQQIIGAVRRAVEILPISARDVRVYLHPEDAAIVREGLSVADNGEEQHRWKIVEDPALTRGGCNIETEHSRIDATVEARLAAVIAQVMGGERGADEDKRKETAAAADAEMIESAIEEQMAQLEESEEKAAIEAAQQTVDQTSQTEESHEQDSPDAQA